MAAHTITGSTHPINRAILDGERQAAVLRPYAEAILADQRINSVSDQTVYELCPVAGASELWTWRRIGSAEDYRHRVTQDRYCIAVSSRTAVDDIVYMVRGGDTGAGLPALRDAARIAAPLVAVLLASITDAGAVDWDTDESVAFAAWRLAMDAALAAHRAGPVPLICPAKAYALTVDHLGLTSEYRDARPIAARWQETRLPVVGRLAQRGIVMDTRRWLLDGPAAAGRVKISRSAWAANVSRGEAPTPDDESPKRWWRSTVDAWRLSRPRTTWTNWG